MQTLPSSSRPQPKPPAAAYPEAEPYAAFISYQHADRKWAVWLQRELETYRVPKELQEQGFPKKLGRVFRDETELVAGRLSHQLIGHLWRSRFLIVVCSPEAARSEWVQSEVRQFLEWGRAERILVLLVRGELDDALPSALKQLQEDTELSSSIWDGRKMLLAADVRPRNGRLDGARARDAKLRLLAAMLECGFDALRQRDQAQRRTRFIQGAVVVCLVALIAGWPLRQYFEERRQGQRQAAESRAAAASDSWSRDSDRALLLAESAARLAPGDDSRKATYGAMMQYLARSAPLSITNLDTEVQAGAITGQLDRVAFKPSKGPPVIVSLTPGTQPRTSLEGSEDGRVFQSFTFSRDGRWVAALSLQADDSTGESRLLQVWDSLTGKLRSSAALGQRIRSTHVEPVGFTAADSRFVIEHQRSMGEAGGVAKDGVYGLWEATVLDCDTGRIRPTQFPIRSNDRIGSSVVDVRSSLGLSLYSQFAEGANLRVIDLSTGQVRSSLHVPGTEGMLLFPRLLGGGKGIASFWYPKGMPPSNEYRELRLDRLGDGTARTSILKPYKTHSPFHPLTLSPDGSRLLFVYLTGISEGMVPFMGLWNVRSSSSESVPLPPGGYGGGNSLPGPLVERPFFTPDGEHLIVSSDDGSRRIWVLDARTLELRSVPRRLPEGLRAQGFSEDGLEVAGLTAEGIVFRWNLLQPAIPPAHRLAVDGLLLSAHVLPDGETLLTHTHRREGATLDFWRLADGAQLGALPARLDTEARVAVSSRGQLAATLSRRSPEGLILSVWSLAKREPLWTKELSGKPEGLGFRGGEEGVVVILRERASANEATVLQFSVQGAGEQHSRQVLPLDREAVVRLTHDGETLVAGTGRQSVGLWSLDGTRLLGRALRFNEASGIDYDLAMSFLPWLQRLQPEGTDALTGMLTHGARVRLKVEAAQTLLAHAETETPVFSPLDRRFSDLGLLPHSGPFSSDGRWYIKQRKSPDIRHASEVFLYEAGTGLAVAGPLVHPFMGKPGRAWPTRLPTDRSEQDPLLASAFLDEGRLLVTVSTYGLLRRWQLPTDARELSGWLGDEAAGTALTGRRLTSSGDVEWLPQEVYLGLRSQHQELLERLRGASPAGQSQAGE